ncbi:MAG: hypothetical protein NTZ17_08300 [Phycisphaerae bacterium]|nr:hypothetical protein [Phycisphaerae bacterium]
MTHGTRRVAAVVALALVFVGVLGLGTGSVAFSQAGHAVNFTLAWLRQAVVGPAPGEPGAEPPALPAASGKTGEEMTNPKEITYTARIFRVHESEAGVWQSLKDQGIEFVAASTKPEVYYAALTRGQAESLDASVTLRCLSTPRVTVSAGEMAALALTDADPQNGRRGFALGLLPTISDDGAEVRSTISFHDGHNGFEIPNVSTEPGGVVLIRTTGVLRAQEDGGESDRDGPIELLIRVQVDIR